jgi:hypothetical protein
MMRSIGVDPACVDLARLFLNDELVHKPVSEQRLTADIQSLSEDIQRAIDNWFLAHENESGG